MRLLANENVPLAAVVALRGAGHDVAWMWELGRGSPDPQVLARATVEQRILVTFDKDFGELAFRAGLEAPVGVVLFRTRRPSDAQVAETAVAALSSPGPWEGYFVVVEEGRVRSRPLPGAHRP